MKRATIIVLLGLAAGCATTPMPITKSPWVEYDKHTKYSIEEKADGFRIMVYFTQYEFYGRSSGFDSPCRWALPHIAQEFANKQGKLIQISQQSIRTLGDRNEVSGVFSCSAEADIQWLAPNRELNPSEPVEAIGSSDVDKPTYQNKENPHDFALVIGVEKYANKLPEAQFAEHDAQAVKDHLIALGYPPRNIKFLTGNRASKGSMEAYLEDWLPKNVKKDSRVFFYFSGHGAPDPTSNQAYLVPVDGDPSYLEKTAFPLKRLYATLSALKAKHVIVALDSCFSGAGGRSVLAEGARPLVSQVDASVTSGGNILLFAATSPNQITSTMKEQGHGSFTYYFLKGLSGSAKDKSGVVTPQGLYDYLKPKVQDAASHQNREQTPAMEGAAVGEMARFK